MGHDYTFRRYVGLAFADEDTREYVASEIKKLNILGVKTIKHDSVSNIKTIQNQRTNKPSFSKSNDDELNNLAYSSEAMTFNIQFHRNYERYYFLEIVILDALSFERESVVKELKKLWWKSIKFFFWDYLTNKVVQHINSDGFKKYPY